jgi:LysM repeat protein
MQDRSRARANPARYLAPIALIAVIAGTYLVVEHGLNTKSKATHSTTSTSIPKLTRSQRRYVKKRFYRVQPGDSLSVVATKTGISVGTIEALNPNIDPNTLQPGQRIRIRR